MDAEDTTLEAILGGAPSPDAWQAVCGLLPGVAREALPTALNRLADWPARLRPMPDAWWEEKARGVHRPWHAASAWRALGDVYDVQNGRPPAPEDDEETDFACFSEGATALACPSDASWLLLCAAAEWHHNGGDVVVWATGPQADPVKLLDGAHFHDEALDAQLSPDETVAVCSVEGRVHAWSTPDGKPRWQVELAESSDTEGRYDMAYSAVRIGFSGDGRRIAAGCAARGVHVVDTASGELVGLIAADPCGPVALDHDGTRLAHAGTSGEIVVRDTASGAILMRHDTGLATVNALAFAPGDAGLAVAGGARDVGRSPGVRPAAVVLTLHGNAVTGSRKVVPLEAPADLVADSPLAAVATRCVWGVHGPLVYAEDDAGAVLFGGDGRVLWTEPGMTCGNLSPDGRVLVTMGEEDVTAVFLDALFPAG
ncbi:WD40 repeat domain-containing protein [Catellatospora bangladeshensis]|uniref:Uncharacterized protein n=1 Tax=Catellatospora bangladeshensis TaxID=310355 RepID=A0A8J3JDE4_9ACTN|nr:WD40 repeat domain-containing protein [Catellatospora bangladeshensis]GIF82847.1 hypothetical protein Cba03nite_41960 [Catellatospora bangladeshensis]